MIINIFNYNLIRNSSNEIRPYYESIFNLKYISNWMDILSYIVICIYKIMYIINIYYAGRNVGKINGVGIKELAPVSYILDSRN